MKNNNSDNKVPNVSIFTCLGMVVGLAIGAGVGNISAGMCIGLCIGSGVGFLIDFQNKNHIPNNDKKEE